MPQLPAPLRLAILWFGGWPRRVLIVACLLLAVLSMLRPSQSPAGRSIDVVVAARGLAAGAVAAAADVRLASVPVQDLPDTALSSRSEVIGQVVGSAMSRGEPFTRARLLDQALTAHLRPGQVAVALTLTDGGQSRLVVPGAHIGLLAPATAAAWPTAAAGGDSATTGSAQASGREIAVDVTVLAVLAASTPTTQASSGASDSSFSVLVATSRETARRLAGLESRQFLATLGPPP